MKDKIINNLYRIRFWWYRITKSKKPDRYNIYRNTHALNFSHNFYSDTAKKFNHHPSWGTYKGSNYYTPNFIKEFRTRYKPKVINGKTIPYESTYAESVYRQKYGIFICKMTLPKEKGSWPAFWLYGQKKYPEIDVFESFNHRNRDIGKSTITLHYGDTEHKQTKGFTFRVERRKSLPRYHVFALDWRENYIKIYVDDVLVYQCTDKKILKYFDSPMHIICNNSITEREAKKMDKDFVSTFYVSNVVIYD